MPLDWASTPNHFVTPLGLYGPLLVSELECFQLDTHCFTVM